MDEKINKMIEDNIKLVPYIVHKNFKIDISINPNLLDEYISVGNLALIDACKGFDESKGFQFATYATSIIWGAIQKFRRYGKNTMRIPARLHKAGTEYSKGINENKDIDTICEETGIPRKDIEEWLSAKDIVNLDAPLQDSEGSSFTRLDMLADGTSIEDSIIDNINHKEKMDILKKVLNDRDFKIVKLIESGVYKQKDISKKMNLNQSYISRILIRLTKAVGPTVEEYHSGRITWDELCKRLHIKEKGETQIPNSAFFDSVLITLQNRFKNTNIEITKATIIETLRNIGIDENSLTKDQMKILLEVLDVKKFEKEINVLCKWLIDNPREQLNMAEELKLLGMPKNSISYYRGSIRDKIIEKMKVEGHDVKEIPFGKGTRLVLYPKKQPAVIKGQPIIVAEEIIKMPENILLDISDIPLNDYNLAFAETLQKSLSMFNILGKSAVLDIKVREVS